MKTMITSLTVELDFRLHAAQALQVLLQAFGHFWDDSLVTQDATLALAHDPAGSFVDRGT